MRRVLLLSVGLHVLALASLLGLRPPAPPEPDEPPRIEVVFGDSGAAPPSPGAASASRASTAAATPRPPDAAEAEPDRAAAASAVPARTGTDDPGLRVERPDPLMLPARDAVGNDAPTYPEQARLLRQQGTVLLRLHIGADGAVTRIETLQSSGVTALDAAATAALARWHFLPAERDGHAVASYRDQPVRFVLD